jgi:hypothetical protein
VAAIVEVLFVAGAFGAAHLRLPKGGAAYRSLGTYQYKELNRNEYCDSIPLEAV